MVIFAVLLTSGLLFGLGALTVDIGNMYEVRREAQSTADLAALAGGDLLQSSPAEACLESLKYLRDNLPRDIDLSTVPDPSATPSPCTSTGTANQIDLNGDGVADTPVVSVTPDKIRVVVPPARVDFGFARALGFSSSHVTAGATVELRNYGGGIGPFAIPAGCIAANSQWYFSIKSGPPGHDGGSGSCTDPTNGSFGWLELQRNGANNNGDLGDDLHYGADHAVGFVPGVDPNYLQYAPAAAPDCTGSISIPAVPTTVTYVPRKDSAGPYTLPVTPNCVSIKTGSISAISDDLVGQNSGSCTGRLNKLSGPAGDKSWPLSPCPVNGYRLKDFLAPNLTTADPSDTYAIADVKADVPGSLTSAIIDNPNFFVVPIVFSTGRPAEKDTPVVGYRGLFLDCSYTDPTCVNPFHTTNGHSISEIDGYVFNLDTIQDPVNDGADVLDYYTGAGIAVPVLTKDPLN